MNLSRLSRDELEAILLDPPARNAEPLRCSERSVLVGLPPATNRRSARLRHALAAAHELLMRIAAQALVGRKALTSPDVVKDYLKLTFAGLEHEVFMLVFLDAQHRVIGTEQMFRGTATQTSVYPREVVKEALACNAAAVILAHNHPSGVAEPSRADELLTQRLKAALLLVDVVVLDHLVVAGGTCISFAERGLI